MKNFEFIDRGLDKTLLLIPGWACDKRIFAHVDLAYNYIYAANLCHAQEIADFLAQSKILKVSILGFSMGSFAALDFIEDHAQYVDKVLLVSISPSPGRELMAMIKSKIEANHKAFLYRFYLSCFTKEDKDGLALFRRELMDKYLDLWDKQLLLDGLEYLSRCRIQLEILKKIASLTVWQARQDKVFDYRDIIGLKEQCPVGEFITSESLGHIPFFNRQFLQDVQQWL